MKKVKYAMASEEDCAPAEVGTGVRITGAYPPERYPERITPTPERTAQGTSAYRSGVLGI
ncbi:MAG: hypothetical protein GX144_06640 [Clostridiaceae bacterium]|nr:hypothetical protein [Clostridiaceae bacterium]